MMLFSSQFRKLHIKPYTGAQELPALLFPFLSLMAVQEKTEKKKKNGAYIRTLQPHLLPPRDEEPNVCKSKQNRSESLISLTISHFLLRCKVWLPFK